MAQRPIFPTSATYNWPLQICARPRGKVTVDRTRSTDRGRADKTPRKIPLGLTPVVAPIRALVLKLDGHDLDLAGRVLAEIFDNLTLHAQALSILSTLKNFLQWPHPLAFFARSSATQRLTILEIPYVVITEEAFVQCLDELPALEQLAVSDHVRRPDHLITNSLLRRLAWTADTTCLVPRLHSLQCFMFLDFDDSVLLDFVRSRLGPRRHPDGSVFKVALTSHAKRTLLPVVAGQLRKLQAQTTWRSLSTPTKNNRCRDPNYFIQPISATTTTIGTCVHDTLQQGHPRPARNKTSVGPFLSTRIRTPQLIPGGFLHF
ncbi:hypothetical protein C8J57DRAFT_1505671 [Mycena rebaudengoi]|nr:hypothetical protein C8J57DRAFT_1505671 [Mycena rebaudengoi]